jgi:hypothetical protein
VSPPLMFGRERRQVLGPYGRAYEPTGTEGILVGAGGDSFPTVGRMSLQALRALR